MPIYDISVPVAPAMIPTYPGDPGIEIESWSAGKFMDILRAKSYLHRIFRFSHGTARAARRMILVKKV